MGTVEAFNIKIALPPSGAQRYPMDDPRARLWLPLLGPTSWLALELFNDRFAFTDERAVLFQTAEVADEIGVKPSVAWNAVMRLAQFNMLAMVAGSAGTWFTMALGALPMHTKAWERVPESVRVRRCYDLSSGWVR